MVTQKYLDDGIEYTDSINGKEQTQFFEYSDNVAKDESKIGKTSQTTRYIIGFTPQKEDVTFFNVWGEAWNNMRSNAQDITLDYSVQDGKFHLWTCIWDEEYISMYVDLDKNPNAAPYCRTKISSDGSGLDPVRYFHHPNHILFNLAVGGNFPQIWDINRITALAGGPRSMYVDYVRIYQMGTPKETLAYPGK